MAIVLTSTVEFPGDYVPQRAAECGADRNQDCPLYGGSGLRRSTEEHAGKTNHHSRPTVQAYPFAEQRIRPGW